MKKRIKKGIKGLTLLLFAFSFSFAQTTESGLKAIEKENYETARSIFLHLLSSGNTDAMNWYNLGNVYCFLGKNDSARWAFTQGTTAAPKLPACFVGLGKTYLNENKVPDAMKYFNQAKSMVNANKDINIALYLADAYSNSSNPNNEEAISILKTAENNITNKNAKLYMELGDAYLPQSNGGFAVSAYERAVELDPTLARAHSKIGYIWYSAKNYQQSLTSFQKALAIDSTFAPAYRDLAELYFYTSQYDKAKQTFAKYLSLADKNDETQYRYAQFLFLTKDYTKALEIINGLKKQNSTKAIMFRLSGYSNYETGNYQEGLNDMEKFFKMSSPGKIIPTDYEYYAKLLGKTGNDSLSYLMYEKVVQVDSTKYGIYKTIADTLYYKKKNYNLAAVYYQKKISKNPKPVTIDYMSLGLSYYFDSSYVNADSAFKQVTELVPDWPNGYLWRARSNMALEKSDSVKGYAIPYFQVFIEKTNADSVKYAGKMTKELMEAYRNLADIYYKLEQPETAIPFYEKYLFYTPKDAEEIKKMVESIKASLKKKNVPK